MRSLLFVVLIAFALSVASANDPGCSQDGAWNETAFSDLIQAIQKQRIIFDKKDVLFKIIEGSTKGFSSPQVATILQQFGSNELIMEEVLDELNPWILQIYSNETATILRLFRNELTRLDVLPRLANITIDLPKDNETILKEFKNKFNREDALEILEKASPRSCVWGDVKEKRIVFLVDTSGSMSTTFKDSNGVTWTRLKFVAAQLDQVIRKNLRPDQEFNVIQFAASAKAWQPGVVPVTPSSIDSAVAFIDSLTPGGGTSMLAGLKLAFSDPKAVAIYLLSDGEPTDASFATILEAAKQWSQKEKPPRPIHAIAFQAGGKFEPKAAEFMYQVAKATGGLHRSIR